MANTKIRLEELLSKPDKSANELKLSTTCPLCHKRWTVTVLATQFDLWKSQWRGNTSKTPFINEVFSSLSPDDREFFLSGIDATCWDKLFPAEEE